MTDALAQLTNLRNEIEAKHQEMKEAAQEAVKEGTKAIFSEYGDILYSFGWRQYTPYFNDGDPCEFTVHDLSCIAKIDLENANEGEREDYLSDWGYEGSPAFDTWSSSTNSKVSSAYGSPARQGDPRYDACLAACQQVYHALSFGDLSKDIFGDHAVITFTPDGVDVDECLHD